MLSKTRIPYLAFFIGALIAVFSLTVNQSFAAVYKSGYASFNTYYQTKSFHLPKGTYTYKDVAKCKIRPALGPSGYAVELYKGNKQIKRILFASCNKEGQSHRNTFKVSSGNYQLRFTKIKGHSTDFIHVTSYSIAK